MVMNKHSYLSTRLVDLNNIKMYTVDKQYKNRRHIGLNAWHFNKLLTLQQRMNIRPLHMNVHELFYLIGVILSLVFCPKT